MKTFNEIRESVLDLIANNKDKQVTRSTSIKKAGIYMLYIDDLVDEEIIPFYIGQTDDFQERFKQHYMQLLALNRLEKSCYKYALRKGLYEGKYRLCKIYSYMVNHKCRLNNFHMIILEEIEDYEQRIVVENKYINELSASFFGFNQMNSVSLYVQSRHGEVNQDDYIETRQSDFCQMLEYGAFGYSEFNWFLAAGIFDEDQKQQLIHKYPIYASILNDRQRIHELQLERIHNNNYNNFQCYKQANEICKDTIEKYFKENGLKSKDKQELVIKVLLYGFDKDINELTKYFSKYASRLSCNIVDMLNSLFGEQIEPIKDKIKSNQKRYHEINEEEQLIQERLYDLLIPTGTYKSHPLASAYRGEHVENVDISENVCHINIEYTCFKANYDSNCFPEICKVDYLIRKNGQIISKTAFVNNSLSNYFVNDELYYYESGFSVGPYNPCLVGPAKTHIPLAMEYRNGINEFTFTEVETVEDISIFKEIEMLIDESTKIVYSTSGYKSTIKWLCDLSRYRRLKILKRIAETVK